MGILSTTKLNLESSRWKRDVSGFPYFRNRPVAYIHTYIHTLSIFTFKMPNLQILLTQRSYSANAKLTLILASWISGCLPFTKCKSTAEISLYFTKIYKPNHRLSEIWLIPFTFIGLPSEGEHCHRNCSVCFQDPDKTRRKPTKLRVLFKESATVNLQACLSHMTVKPVVMITHTHTWTPSSDERQQFHRHAAPRQISSLGSHVNSWSIREVDTLKVSRGQDRPHVCETIARIYGNRERY